VGDASKASKKGRLTLTRDAEGRFQTRRIESLAAHEPDLLETVFENGTIVRQTTFDAVRERAAAGTAALVVSRAPL